MIEGACACGGVRVRMARAPVEVTSCDCSACHPYGVLWAYCAPADAAVTGETDSWSRGARSIAFHRCRACGCVTHWAPVTRTEPRMAVNARLLPRAVLAAARLRRLDGLVTERYLDA